MRVHHLYIASTPDRARYIGRFLDLLDAHPELYYRVVGDELITALPDQGCPLRVALAAAHVVIVLVGQDEPSGGMLDDELRIARQGFSRCIPVIAVLTPGTPDGAASGLGADHMIAWDGEVAVATIEACCQAPVMPRRTPRRMDKPAGVQPAATPH